MAKRKISGIINATEHPMNLETPWNQKQPDGTYHAYAGDDVEAFLKKELSNRTPSEELVSGETKPPTSGTVFDAMVGTVNCWAARRILLHPERCSMRWWVR